MTNLLRADFARLFQSRLFLVCMALMIGFSVSIACAFAFSPDSCEPADALMYGDLLYIAIVIAAFAGAFVGTDYSSGTIRSKQIIHTRVSVYLSGLVLCITASLMFHAAWAAVFFIFEKIGLLNEFIMSGEEITLSVVVSIFAVTALASIFHMLCMMISNQIASSATVLILSFIMLYASETLAGESDPLLSDVLPACQFMQLNDIVVHFSGEYYVNMPKNFSQLPYYSVFMILLTATIGILRFRKMDLK